MGYGWVTVRIGIGAKVGVWVGVRVPMGKDKNRGESKGVSRITGDSG